PLTQIREAHRLYSLHRNQFHIPQAIYWSFEEFLTRRRQARNAVFCPIDLFFLASIATLRESLAL
ncbi:hypothetical protein KC734_23440, partial [candidate division KSB1 bacterium]|nr:hypothetical protein [candidate division KSB1 bacterium]